MTDQPALAERVAVLKDGGRTFRAAWRIVGDIEGGTLELEPRGVLRGWSLEQVRSAIWAAILRGSITLAGIPARVRGAVRSGTLCIGRLLRSDKTMRQNDDPPPTPGTRLHPSGVGRPRTARRLARTRWARLDDAARSRLMAGPGHGFKSFWAEVQAGVWGGP